MNSTEEIQNENKNLQDLLQYQKLLLQEAWTSKLPKKRAASEGLISNLRIPI